MPIRVCSLRWWLVMLAYVLVWSGGWPSLAAQEAPSLSPALLPGILAEGAAGLGKDIQALKDQGKALKTGQEAETRDFQEFRGRVLTLKASMAVKELSPKEAEVALKEVEERLKQVEALHKEVEARSQALRQRQEFANLTDALFKAGKVTHLDSFRAQSQVSEAEQAVVEAQNARTVARQILARSLGVKEDAQVDIKGRLPQEFPAAGKVDTLWQEVLKNNPEIKRLDLQLAQSQSLVKAARGGYFPELSLQGSIDVRHRDQAGNLTNLTKEEYLYGVFLEFPFFQGGLTRAQVVKASSQYRQLLEKQRDRINNLRVELMTGWKEQENARQGRLPPTRISLPVKKPTRAPWPFSGWGRPPAWTCSPRKWS